MGHLQIGMVNSIEVLILMETTGVIEAPHSDQLIFLRRFKTLLFNGLIDRD